MSIRTWVVSNIYATHNRQEKVRRPLQKFLEKSGADDLVLNIGSGGSRLAPNVRNLDITEGPNVDIVASALDIPLPDRSVDRVVSQEVFEHLSDDRLGLSECFRILKHGGEIWFQVPFVIGYHPSPKDFRRYTEDGIRWELELAGFRVLDITLSVGGATGFYRIAVEFFAILLSGPFTSLYRPMKGFFAIALCGVRLLDPWFDTSRERHRVAGGFIAVAVKP